MIMCIYLPGTNYTHQPYSYDATHAGYCYVKYRVRRVFRVDFYKRSKHKLI